MGSRAHVLSGSWALAQCLGLSSTRALGLSGFMFNMSSWAHGLLGNWALGHLGTRLMGSRAHGPSGSWALGLMGFRAHGLSGSWALGLMGSRAHGLLHNVLGSLALGHSGSLGSCSI
jgi:hypothetical protein